MEKGYLLSFFSQIAMMARPKKEKEKEKENKTVHGDNPHQTYKLIYGLIKQGNLNQVWGNDSASPRSSLMKLLIDEGHE